MPDRIVEMEMKLWGPADAAQIAGTTPELLRRWKHLGLTSSSPVGLRDAGGAIGNLFGPKRRGQFGLLHLVEAFSARTLFDSGVPYKGSERLIALLVELVLWRCLKLGEVEVPEAATVEWLDRAFSRLRHEASPLRDSAKRYLVVRPGPGDTLADRTLVTDQLSAVERWLDTAVQDAPVGSCVVLDSEALARGLLQRMGGAYARFHDLPNPGELTRLDEQHLAAVGRSVSAMKQLESAPPENKAHYLAQSDAALEEAERLDQEFNSLSDRMTDELEAPRNWRREKVFHDA